MYGTSRIPCIYDLPGKERYDLELAFDVPLYLPDFGWFICDVNIEKLSNQCSPLRLDIRLLPRISANGDLNFQMPLSAVSKAFESFPSVSSLEKQVQQKTRFFSKKLEILRGQKFAFFLNSIEVS